MSTTGRLTPDERHAWGIPTPGPVTYTGMAGDLVEGDIVANVGRVDGPPIKVGAFVLVTVVAQEWSPATGRKHVVIRRLFLHAADDVIVEHP